MTLALLVIWPIIHSKLSGAMIFSVNVHALEINRQIPYENPGDSETCKAYNIIIRGWSFVNSNWQADHISERMRALCVVSRCHKKGARIFGFDVQVKPQRCNPKPI